MKKSIFICLACAALLAAFVLPSLLSATPAAPADMVISVPDGATATKAPVAFSHTTGHANIECATCHHKWDGAGDIVACSSCHNNMDDKKSDDSFYNAYHANTEASCVGCHKALKKAGEATGPTSCNDCHPRQ